jgi:uncharacterized membrane protein YqjE
VEPSNPKGRPATAAPPGLFDSLSTLLASFAGYMQARLELLGLESRAAARNYLRVLALAFVAILALALGYIFAVLGLVFLVHGWTRWSWPALTAAFGGAHLVVVVICALLIKNRVSAPAFTETIAELRKDRVWLDQEIPRPGSPK